MLIAAASIVFCNHPEQVPRPATTLYSDDYRLAGWPLYFVIHQGALGVSGYWTNVTRYNVWAFIADVSIAVCMVLSTRYVVKRWAQSQRRLQITTTTLLGITALAGFLMFYLQAEAGLFAMYNYSVFGNYKNLLAENQCIGRQPLPVTAAMLAALCCTLYTASAACSRLSRSSLWRPPSSAAHCRVE